MNIELGGEMGTPEHEAFSNGKDGAQPPVVAVHPSDVARSPREIQMREPGTEWTMTVRPPVVVANMRDSFPRQKPGTIEPNTYFYLGTAPLHVIHAQRDDAAEAETIVVGPRVTARDISALFYFASPLSGNTTIYNFDTQDTINDWWRFDEDTPESRALVTAHETMPGFKDFQKQRQQILGVLSRNYTPIYTKVSSNSRNFDTADPQDVLYPVLRIKNGPDGTKQIVLDAMDDGMRAAIAEALPEQFAGPDAAARMNTGMGIAYAAAYSPEHTDLDARDGYVKRKVGEDFEGSKRPKQTIGPTQVLGVLYRNTALQQQGSKDVPRYQNLQASPLVVNLATYAETGEAYWLPEVPRMTDKRTPSLVPPNDGKSEALESAIGNYGTTLPTKTYEEQLLAVFQKKGGVASTHPEGV